MTAQNTKPSIMLVIILITSAFSCLQAEESAVLNLTVLDAETGNKIPARILVRDAHGQDYVPDSALVVPICQDKWFACKGVAELELEPGPVTLRAERGPEYRPVCTSIMLSSGKEVNQTILLKRWINMKTLGYSSGENHVHLGIEQAAVAAAAEDLDFATVLSWWHRSKISFSKESPWVQSITVEDITVPTAVFCGEKEDGWGAVYVIGLRSPVEFEGGPHRANLAFVQSARKNHGLVCYQGGWSREVLVDALAGHVDVVNVCNNNFHRHKFQPRQQYSNLLSVEGFPEYPNSPEGMMAMNTEMYYRLLNCGLRLAAGAGSAIGAKNTPIGYNRTYVRAGDNPTMEQFLDGWRQGKNFATNGPMLFLKTSRDHRPGDTVELPAEGGNITFTAEAFSEQPLRSLEIVANGEVISAARPASSDTHAKVSVTVDMKEGTWIAARCTEEDLLLTDSQLENYREGSGFFSIEPCRLRFAHTSPIYVTVNGRGAKVDNSIQEAGKMLRAFRDFAQNEATEEHQKEILEILDTISQRMQYHPLSVQ